LILIVGLPDDPSSARVYQRVTKAGGQAFFFDTLAFPSQLTLSFDNNTPANGIIQVKDQRLSLTDFTGVYRRWSKGIATPQDADPQVTELVYWNIESAIGSFSRCMDCLWINSQQATDMHKYKGYQLKLMQQAGIPLPDTIITNDAESVRAFYDKHHGHVIYKPVRGWAHTEKLTPNDLTDERLSALKQAPIKLQQLILGTDIRAYWVDGTVYAMTIETDTLDFRESPEAPRQKITLPDSVFAQIQTLTQTLGLVFSGIDLRLTPSGEYVFFEANPTPVFVWDEDTTGYGISQHLAHLLITGKTALPITAPALV
jgi:hypothetical protein